MSPFLQLALTLALIILAAKICGYLSYRLNQPAVLGELLIGILIGPSVLDLLHLPIFTDTHLPEVIHELAELGALLLMFLAGLSLHLDDMLRSGKISALSGILGVIFPLGLGTGTGLAFGMEFQQSIFLGLILSATSVSISAQTLIELKQLLNRVGISLMGAAVFDDVIVVLGLALFVSLTQPAAGGGFGSVLLVIVQMILFLILASAFGYWLLPSLARRVHSLPISQGLVAFAFVILLLYGWSAEIVGNMAAITGAFLGGVWLARSPLKDQIEKGIGAMAYAVFVPIFFVNIGLTANAKQLNPEAIWLLVVIVIVAVIGKILGAGLGAYLSGFNIREALQLGVGMISRGEVGLIVATVGIAEGLITPAIFSIVVAMVLITTILTPPLLRYVFSLQPRLKPDANRETSPDNQDIKVEGDQI